jgi:hypothetical protein
MVYQSGRGISQEEFSEGLERLKHIIAWVMDESRLRKDWKAAIRAALLLRHFFPKEGPGDSPTYVSRFCLYLDAHLGVKNPSYVYATFDEIANQIDERIASPSGNHG